MSGGIPYIGSRISLISRKNIRYEGVLYNIDTKESSVALKTVRSFGTEDRQGEHGEQVPPSASVYEYVIFRGADIKDLHVCEAAPAPSTNLPDDPAIINSQVSPPAPPTTIPEAPAKQKPKAPVASAVPQPKPQLTPATSPPVSENDTTRQRGRNPGGNRTIPGMGGHLLKRRERGAHEDKKLEPVNSEFDFKGGLEGFDKMKEYSKLTLDATPGPVAPASVATLNEDTAPSSSIPKQAYQRSSFFDSISCDALDRLEGKSGRLSHKEERQLNTETFGAIGLNTDRRYRGRGRGRGYRGGRGRGRGRYTNSNNNNNHHHSNYQPKSQQPQQKS